MGTVPADVVSCPERDGDPPNQNDPWAGVEGLEPPAGDPWSAPQQAQRGPRAGMRDGLVLKARIAPNWFDHDNRFWYRNDLADGTREFIVVDADRGALRLAFDHQKLAAALFEGRRRRSIQGRQAAV